jgi:hypothetical protein
MRFDGADVAGYQTTLTYDENVAEVTSVSASGTFGGSPTTNVDNADGEVRIADGKSDGVNGPVLVDVEFDIVGSTGENTSVDVDSAALYDQDGEQIGTLTRNDGLVGAVGQGDGDVDGDGSVTAADVVLVQRYVVGDDVSIDTDAADVNGDGSVDASDALLIEQMLVGA